MPHCTVEYTANIENRINIKEILQAINNSLLSHNGEFSASGIRSRAYMVADYIIGDGITTDAFIHVSLSIATGRTTEVKQAIQDHLFTTLTKLLNQIDVTNKISLSLELTELNSEGKLYSQT